jgi:hypothetical protein
MDLIFIEHLTFGASIFVAVGAAFVMGWKANRYPVRRP